MLPPVLVFAFCFGAGMSCSTPPADPCPELRLVRRSEWGARAPVRVNRLPGPVSRAFVHHTAMDRCRDLLTCCAEMRRIQDLHMDGRGWWDIGYSFLVGGDGRVYEGRGWDAEGAHTRGFNSASLAVSLMGDFSAEQPPPRMLEAARDWISCGIRLGKMAAETRVSGHRDAGCTECPGEALYRIVETWPRFERGPLPGYRCPGADATAP